MTATLSELPVPPAKLSPRPSAAPRIVQPLPTNDANRGSKPPRPLAGTPLPAPPRLRPRQRVAPAPTPMPGPTALGSLPTAPLHLPPAPPTAVEPPPSPEIPEQAPSDLPPLELPDARPEPTDADLQGALMPIVETAVGRALYAPETGIHSYLEPLLRTTVRRALAELEAPEQPFASAGLMDRLLWRLQALCTSRTYDEILFEKTARHRIEATLLLGHEALDLISYASTDPGCHASPRRVQPLLREVLPRLRDSEGALNLAFDLAEDRRGVVREGRYTYLIAIVRGSLDEYAQADLDFIHRRIEERYGARLQDPSAPLLRRIQPMLEDCLLIRSPAAGL